MKATSDLVINSKITAVLALGDLQYQDGTIDKFQKSYHPTWGRLKNITYPVPGNHEYYSKNAAGYYKYFGQRAGDPTKGYYSFNIGKWKVIALNSNCDNVGGCDINSPQVKWLKQELTKNKNQCTLAFWHHPRFSSGSHGDNKNYDTFWQVLYKAGVEIILTGHDHTYERFAKINPEGVKDQKGLRQFVVGTGGASLYKFKKNNPNTEARNSDTYGVLQLTLKPDGYDWQFVPENGKTFTDSGSDVCH
ncbi:MAG TPA: metallophosphoesterase, partial [Allocoleopsis sp.]